MNNTKLNPLYNALDGIDEDIAVNVLANRKKNKKPLKIVILSVAAAALLGTTAAAAGTAVILASRKAVIDGVTYTPGFSSYIDKNGMRIEVTAIPYSNYKASYEAVGESRGVYNEHDRLHEMRIFDELGIELPLITNQAYEYSITKAGEKTERDEPDIVASTYTNADQEKFNSMSVDEKIDYFLNNQVDLGRPGYIGFEHPSMREIFSDGGTGRNAGNRMGWEFTDIINFDGLPGHISEKYYNFSLDQLEGFTEKDGLQILQYFNQFQRKISEEEVVYKDRNYLDEEDPRITQQIFIYTMIDDESGKDVKFTVWRSADEKEDNTGCFDFYYEYIPLNNGTEARLHQSADSKFIVDFEKDGSAYAVVTEFDRELVDRVLTNMNLL